MLARRRSPGQTATLVQSAPVFAALGERTRLRLLMRLGSDSPTSIARLTDGTHLTRQVVTKHLRVLADTGLARSVRHGRELRFQLEAGPLEEARRSLELIARRWDEALLRLKAGVEGD
jgi:DNA-binding transcriptional ArsR family regulator